MSNLSSSSQQKFYSLSIPTAYGDKKYFIFKGKNYPFDFTILIENSIFFNKNQNLYENVEYIELLSETETKKFHNISEKAVQDFISLSTNGACQIDNSSIYYIQYLSIKYQVINLTKAITNLITKNKNEFILDYFDFKFEEEEKKEDDLLLYSEEINIIADNLINYINDDRMFKFPIWFLYQVFIRFCNFTNFNIMKLNEKCTFITFLFKCLDKIGRDASILFSICDFGDKTMEIIEKLISEYSTVFDFNLISNDLLKFSIDLKQEKNQIKQLKLFHFSIKLSFSFEDDAYKNQLHEKVINYESFRRYSNLITNLEFSEPIANEKYSIEKVDDKELTSIQEGVEEIPDNQFKCNTSIKNIIIPPSVTIIGQNAFFGCSSLTKIEIPKTVKLIKYIRHFVDAHH